MYGHVSICEFASQSRTLVSASRSVVMLPSQFQRARSDLLRHAHHRFRVPLAEQLAAHTPVCPHMVITGVTPRAEVIAEQVVRLDARALAVRLLVAVRPHHAAILRAAGDARLVAGRLAEAFAAVVTHPEIPRAPPPMLPLASCSPRIPAYPRRRSNSAPSLHNRR